MRFDRRHGIILVVVAAAIIATGVIYYLHIGLDPATHFGAVFAAWVGGLSLFLITGIVIAVLSLARPEEESFDSRARILFRRQEGKHIDYIVSKIKEVLEHYAECTEIRMGIVDYHPGDKKYRLTQLSDTTVRSYLDDVESTYVSESRMSHVTLPPNGGAPNRLVYTRVDGAAVGTPEVFTTDVARPITCRIDRDGSCPVSILREFWTRADDEDNTHTPKRYTQVLRLLFENLLPSNEPVEIKFTTDGINWVDLALPNGSRKQVMELKDVKPGVLAFNFRVKAPPKE